MVSINQGYHHAVKEPTTNWKQSCWCKEDADTHIFRCALELATTSVRVSVVADDTDVALLLLYH